MRLANVKKSKPIEIKEVSYVIRKAIQGFSVCHLEIFRISTYAIEFDLFTAKKDVELRAVRGLEKYAPVIGVRDLDREQIFINKNEVMKITKDLFDQERYWECHEIVELIWRKEKNLVEKTLQQGVILFASALVHAQKNEEVVCLSMLGRTREKLDVWSESEYYGLNIDKLKKSLSNMVETHDVILPSA